MTDTPSTATLLFVAHRAAESQVMAALREAGFDDLTVAQCRILQRLDARGTRVTDLAERAQVTKQTAGALIAELECSGYVARSPDPSDRRARLVTLTDKGTRLCEAAAAEVSTVEESWRRHVGADAFGRLRETLSALREITDPYR